MTLLLSSLTCPENRSIAASSLGDCQAADKTSAPRSTGAGRLDAALLAVLAHVWFFNRPHADSPAPYPRSTRPRTSTLQPRVTSPGSMRRSQPDLLLACWAAQRNHLKCLASSGCVSGGAEPEADFATNRPQRLATQQPTPTGAWRSDPSPCTGSWKRGQDRKNGWEVQHRFQGMRRVCRLLLIDPPGARDTEVPFQDEDHGMTTDRLP